MLIPYSDPIKYTHFFGINRSIFDRLIEFLEQIRRRPPGHPDGGPMSPDGALTTFRARNPGVVTLIANPSLGWQRSSRTDCHSQDWFDCIPITRGLAALIRRGRSRLSSYR